MLSSVSVSYKKSIPNGLNSSSFSVHFYGFKFFANYENTKKAFPQKGEGGTAKP